MASSGEAQSVVAAVGELSLEARALEFRLLRDLGPRLGVHPGSNDPTALREGLKRVWDNSPRQCMVLCTEVLAPGTSDTTVLEATLRNYFVNVLGESQHELGQQTARDTRASNVAARAAAEARPPAWQPPASGTVRDAWDIVQHHNTLMANQGQVQGRPTRAQILFNALAIANSTNHTQGDPVAADIFPGQVLLLQGRGQAIPPGAMVAGFTSLNDAREELHRQQALPEGRRSASAEELTRRIAIVDEALRTTQRVADIHGYGQLKTPNKPAIAGRKPAPELDALPRPGLHPATPGIRRSAQAKPSVPGVTNPNQGSGMGLPGS